MTKRRDIMAVVSDLHTTSTVALSPDRILLDDGHLVRPSKAQRWINQCWADFWTRVRGYEPIGEGKRWLLVDGECVDGDHHDTTQIISRNPADWVRAATEVLDAPCQWADRRFFLRGTEAHSGKAGHLDELIAADLGGEPDPERGTHSWWHLLLEVNGVRIDVAHHPPSTSSRPWTSGNAANTLAAMTIMEYATHRERIPDLCIRAHVHRFSDSGSNYPCRAIITPCWQLATAYSHRRFPGQLADIGGVIIIIEDGHADVIPVRFAPKARQPWKE